jgi:hypothetical protein
VGGTRYAGEWAQIKVPYPITLAYCKFGVISSYSYRTPNDGTILGSNDGEHWYKLTEWNGKVWDDSTNTFTETIDVNATTPYQHYRLVMEKGGTYTDTYRMQIGEWRLFAEKPVTRMENVHISGHLSSETLQTGYIKWPRKNLKANESEGYVASASSTFNTDETGLAYNAFNNYITNSGATLAPNWQSAVSFNSSGEPLNGTAISFDGMDGEWIQIQMPNKIALSHFTIGRRNDYGNSVNSGYMYGSNDGINWTRLVYFNGITYSLASTSNTAFKERVNVESKQTFNHYRLFITKINPAGGNYRVVLEELQLFEAATGVGAAPTSAKLQVAGSLGMAKGSEFFAGDDVVMELPKHDRPLVKYPEIKLTSASSYAYENGYQVQHSSENSSHPAYNLFDGSIATRWLARSTNDPYSATSPYLYTGSSNITEPDGTQHPGAWVRLELPKAIKLSHVVVKENSDPAARTPGKITFLGSNDDQDWYFIKEFSGMSNTATQETYFINETKYYKHLAFVVKNLSDNDGALDLGEVEYWGTEEGDTSVDVVHRSIPNKPGQQHLEVYWDANDSNSYSFADSDAVYDLSGSGVTGTITGTNGFDAEYNAWVFDGSGDYISGTHGLGTGNPVHSMSLWFKRSGVAGTYDYIVAVGNSTTFQNSAIVINANRVWFSIYGDELISTLSISNDIWYHLVVTSNGGVWNSSNCKMYINGVSESTSTGDGNTLNMTGTTVRLGTNTNGGEGFNGSIANFRLFSKTLNADQVRELYEYDAPRFGHRQNLVALHKGNLGVGVAHPTSRFEVAGTETLQEYPPKGMTGYETYIEGHGVFKASESSIYSVNPSWRAFDNSYNELSWLSGEDTYNADGTATGASAVDTFESIAGSWLGLELPIKIKLECVIIQNRDSASIRNPIDGIIWGTNNGTKTLVLYSWTYTVNRRMAPLRHPRAIVPGGRAPDPRQNAHPPESIGTPRRGRDPTGRVPGRSLRHHGG